MEMLDHPFVLARLVTLRLSSALRMWNISAGTTSDKSYFGHVSLSDYVDTITNARWILRNAGVIIGLMAAQLLFVWPVKKPAPKNQRGWPVWISLTVAGLAIAGLSLALM